MRTAILAVAAIALTGCAGMPMSTYRYGTIAEPGFVCRDPANARLHETLRTKKDATPYEVEAAMHLPDCLMVADIGRKVTIWSGQLEPGLVEIRPAGKISPPFWAPGRMVRPD